MLLFFLVTVTAFLSGYSPVFWYQNDIFTQKSLKPFFRLKPKDSCVSWTTNRSAVWETLRPADLAPTTTPRSANFSRSSWPSCLNALSYFHVISWLDFFNEQLNSSLSAFAGLPVLVAAEDVPLFLGLLSCCILIFRGLLNGLVWYIRVNKHVIYRELTDGPIAWWKTEWILEWNKAGKVSDLFLHQDLWKTWKHIGKEIDLF